MDLLHGRADDVNAGVALVERENKVWPSCSVIAGISHGGVVTLLAAGGSSQYQGVLAQSTGAAYHSTTSGLSDNQVAHCAAGGKWVLSTDTSGSCSRTWSSSCCSQGCKTPFGALGTPLARTSPVAGRNRVNNLAVPPRMYSWGWHCGRPSSCQD
jgi:hypothetical protein